MKIIRLVIDATAVWQSSYKTQNVMAFTNKPLVTTLTQRYNNNMQKIFQEAYDTLIGRHKLFIFQK